jgi:hypothetical protein
MLYAHLSASIYYIFDLWVQGSSRMSFADVIFMFILLVYALNAHFRAIRCQLIVHVKHYKNIIHKSKIQN